MQNLTVPLQVAIKTCLNKIQRKDLNSKLNFKPRYMVDYTVEPLKNIVATIVTLGVSQPSHLKEISF
jgi:hypothetical protein